MKTRFWNIIRATKQHSFNLAQFVALYKTLLVIQKKVNGGKQRSFDTFIAGLIGGYYVFGDRNAVNEQVCMRTSPNISYGPLTAHRSCSTSARA